MSTNQFIQYGHAKKPFEQLNAEELAEMNKRLDKKIRDRAWAVGSPIYYGVNGLVIAEYEDGKKMIIEEINGQMVETKEYHG
jgi:transcription termination factor Rho